MKNKGLVVLPALFLLWSCDEVNEIGADLNPEREAYTIHYLELPVVSTQLQIRDSLITSTTPPTGPNTPGRPLVVLGRYSDPTFGTTTATVYSNIGLPVSVPTINSNARADSLVLELNYGNNVRGTDLAAEQQFSIHRLLEPIQPTSTETVTNTDGIEVSVLQHQYSITDHFGYEAQALGNLSFQLSKEQLDTLASTERIVRTRLDNSLGELLLGTLQTDDSLIRNDQREFSKLAGGIAIVPAETNTYTNTYTFLPGATAGSRLILYYTQGTENKSLAFPFSALSKPSLLYQSFPTFTGLKTEFTGTPLEGADQQAFNTSFSNPDGRVFYQALNGLIPKFSYTSFRDLSQADTSGLLGINKAYLEVDQVANQLNIQDIPGGLLAQPSNEIVGTMVDAQNNRQFTNTQLMLAGYTQASDTLYAYRIDITRELEAYLESGNESFLNMVLSPTEASRLSLKQAAIEPENVKLKLYFTEYKR